MDLNFPFRAYPIRSSNIITPFINSDYIRNAKRLYNDIEALSETINEKELVLLIIGSLIDEDPDKYYSNNSYLQHLPIFIKKYIQEDRYNNVRIICISPKINDGIPQFIKKTMNEYKWYKIDDCKYVSRLYNLTYDFYNTLYPEYIESDFVTLNNKEYYLNYNGKYLRLPKLYFKNKCLRSHYETEYIYSNQVILKLKDNLILDFYNIYKSSPSEHDKYFVSLFNEKLTNLITKLQDKSGSMLVLNYAVFCDNWICASFYHFFESFYNQFNKFQNVKILNYEFLSSDSSTLTEYNKRSYDYEDYNIILKIGRKGRINIITNNFKSEFNESKKEYKLRNAMFDYLEIEGDGDCLFNSILKQVSNTYINVHDARKIICKKILDDNTILSMLKDEICIMPEYEMFLKQTNDIDKALELHLYFIREGPYSEEAEHLRKKLDLPFSVFFGGNCEIGLLGNLFNINIKVINYDNNIINVMSNNYEKTIYIKFNGNHYDIAIPKDNLNNEVMNMKHVNNLFI